jgi:hypothetical protein
MTTHSGSCHCGAVKFEADLDLSQPVNSCNCSHCSRKGFLLAFIPAATFRQTTDAPLTEYRFNREHIAHQFCPTCGVQAFAKGKHPATGLDIVAVNVRCIPGVDLDALTINKVDGAKL